MQVFVLSKDKKPLMPTSPMRARQLLKERRAVIHKRVPFTIRLKDRVAADSEVQPVRLKLDPGSKVTGIAISRENPTTDTALHLAELHHKQGIPDKLLQRKGLRRRRRTENLRYRPCRPHFPTNRKKGDPKENYKVHSYRSTVPENWLPPTLVSRVEAVTTWVARYRNLVPISAISVETVRFDMQLMENPEISGIEYQQGTLWGYETRQYLLEKWGHKCAYCGAKNVPLQMEHLNPKSRGGSDRIPNLAVACEKCNQKKGNKTAAEFGFPHLEAQARKPLKDAAAVNSTRWAIYNALKATGLPIEMSTGGCTKFNRHVFGIPKTHCLDAVCVGNMELVDRIDGVLEAGVLVITVRGRGDYKRTDLDKYGFPRNYKTRQKRFNGIQSGDLVSITIDKGIHQGTRQGDVQISNARENKLKIYTAEGKKIERSADQFQLIQRGDGYLYEVYPSFDRFADTLENFGLVKA